MIFRKKVSFKLFLFPFFLSSIVQAENTNHKIGAFCIFQDNPSQGEWAKDANGNIIEINVNFVQNIKCADREFEENKLYTDFYTVEISSLNILIDSCKNLKKSLLKNNSSRKWIENQNINFNKLENYLSPQARKIPQTNEANTNYTLYPFAIQNQVYKNDFLLLSTYYNCK